MKLATRIALPLFLLLWPLAAKTPLTHETMWLMKRVGAPSPSPDGKWVVFPVTEPAYDANTQVSDLWIVPADGSAKPRRLTFSKGAESGVAWSPDSRRIAFSAKREGDAAAQIYVLDVAGGGEAIRVTSLSTGAGSPQWRPDGGAILFTSNVYPGAADDDANRKIAAERKARKYNVRAYDSFPIRQWDHWIEDTHAHAFVQGLTAGSKAKDVLAGSKLVAEPGFAGLANALTGTEELEAVWTPDGASIVFTATTTRNRAAYSDYNTHLYQVSAAGGEPRPISTGSDSYSSPKFSPDGKALYCGYKRHGENGYYLERVAMFQWPSPGERTIVTSSFDRSVSDFALSSDGKTLYMLAEDSGQEKVFRAPAAGGAAAPLMENTAGCFTRLAIPARAASTVLYADWESAVSPTELVAIDPGGPRQRALTAFNADAVANIDWQPVRHFTFTSKRGKQIHNMIALPPDFDESKKYPLLVLMHGGPHNMWRDQFFLRWNYHLLARPGYVLLLTNYTGSTGFGEKFAQEIRFDPLKGPGDEISEAADEATRRFAFIDATRQAAAGASYGGHLANWMQATTTRYKCLVAHAGLINLESQWGTSDMIYHRELNAGGPPWEQGKVWREQNPIRYAKNFKTPILLSVGEHDFRVPINETLENWSTLQRQRVPSRLLVFPDANHWIGKAEDSRYWYQEVENWLKKYL